MSEELTNEQNDDLENANNEGNENETDNVEGLQKGVNNNPSSQSSQTKGEGEGENDDEAPENYDFKNVELPDGMELDKDLTKEFTDAAKEMGLSQAKADKFMGMGVKLTSKIQEKFETALKEAQQNQIKSYKTMLNTDKEIGGANLKTTLQEANKAYQTFVSDEAADILAKTGLNNHPAIVKMFRDIGRQIKDDSIKGGQNQKHERTAEDWYPNMKKG